MTMIISNGLQLAYEEHGHSNDPVLLMVQGLGMPLSAWPPELITALVAERFRVIVFDNRDIGQSQLMHDSKVPNMLIQTLRRKLGLKVKAPYQLVDMMHDVSGLMDALDISSAHLVGVSMGGMISQLLAIHKPERVISLTSIMSTTGSRKLPGPAKEVTRHIVRGPASATDEGRLEYQWKLWRLLGGPDYRQPDEELREFLSRNLERGTTAAGIARQTLAILAAPSRTAALKMLRVPALVIHGDADPLIPVECGMATALAIPGARTEIIKGMGHDLPVALTGRLAQLIVDHARTYRSAD